MERVERHHTLWTRKDWSVIPISKQVRQLSTFVVDTFQPNHRLLHARMRPPELPEHEILVEMRGLAINGLQAVIERLDHPIVEHLEEQMSIITLNPTVAWRMIDTGLYHIPLTSSGG